MRICIVVGYFDWFSGYQETVLAKSLSRLGHRVSVLASDRCNPVFSDDALRRLRVGRKYTELEGVEFGVRVHRHRARLSLRSLVYAGGVTKELNRSSYDLVVFFYPGQLLPGCAAVASNLHPSSVSCVIYADNSMQNASICRPLRRIKGFIFTWTKGLLYNAVNRRVDFVCGNTNNCLNFVGRVESPSGRGCLLPLAFDEKKFFWCEMLRVRKRRELGIAESEICIVSVGKITPVKRLDSLIRVVDALMREGYHLRVVLVGAGESDYCNGLRRQIAEETLFPDRFVLKGFVPQEEVNDLYNAADIGIWPFQPAVSIQQAMATGLWVVLPWNDCVDHLLDQENGKYFESESLVEMSNAISKLVADSNMFSIHDRAQRAKLNVSRFSSSSVARQFLELAVAGGL